MADLTLPPAGTVLAMAVPAVLTFGTAAALSAAGQSTTLAAGVGIVVGIVAGQVVRRVRH